MYHIIQIYNFKLFYILVYSIILVSRGDCVNYRNFTLYKSTPTSLQDLVYFKSLLDEKSYDVVFWRAPYKEGLPVEFMIPPEFNSKFVKDARDVGISIFVMMDDVQSAFDAQINDRPNDQRQIKYEYDWNSYYRLLEIYGWMDLMQTAFPEHLTIITIGKSVDGRDIKVAKVVAQKNNKTNIIKRKVFVEGGIHGREWIAPAFVMYIMRSLLTCIEDQDNVLVNLLHTYDWYLLPVMNPDGYELSHTVDRMWRTNVRKVDLNRNFYTKDAGDYDRKDVNSEAYCGPKPFSEPETVAVEKLMEAIGDTTEYYLNFHSYGQQMIIPYAYHKDRQDNYGEVHFMCQEAAHAIMGLRGTIYNIGNAYETVGYLATGVSSDWAKKTFKIPYVVTFELNDRGRYGFALPYSEILPVCQETMQGIKSMMTRRIARLGDLLDLPAGRNKRTLMNKSLLLFNFFLIFLYSV